MRAPLAILLAAGMMVGGGYAGLVWLASPSTVGHGASSRSQNASSAPNANVRSEAVVDENGSAGRTQNEESTSLSPLRTGGGPTMSVSNSAQQAAENNQSSATGSLTEQTGATKAPDVRAGGCMPIGITAGGNLVFPMACRELLEQHRGAHASLQARPEPTPAGPPEQSGTVNQDVQTADSVRDEDIQSNGLARGHDGQIVGAVPDHDLQTVDPVVADQNAANSSSKGNDIRSAINRPPKVKLARDGSRTMRDNGNVQEKMRQSSRTLNSPHQQQRLSELLKDPLAFNCMNCLLFGY
jgi:hypothetical protein